MNGIMTCSLRDALGALREQKRRALRVHPQPEDLSDYLSGCHLGVVREQLRDHLALCSTCCERLLCFAEPIPISKEDLAQCWRELAARLATD
jgi:hypothetical protein